MAEDLLPRIALGDRTAVPACLDRYGQLVWSLARRLAGADSEDLVQEIFLEVWKSAHRYDPQAGSEVQFIAMLARRRLIDHIRRRASRVQPGTLAGEIPALDGEKESSLEQQDTRALLEAGLRQLRPEECQIIRLSIHDGLTHEAIREKTGMPLGTVKSHLRRGLQRLKDWLTERGHV